jgi:hypothetical protein
MMSITCIGLATGTPPGAGPNGARAHGTGDQSAGEVDPKP